MPSAAERQIRVAVDGDAVVGDLALHGDAIGVVVFAHGSGSSRHSRRNRQVAERLQQLGLGTLLMDLLTAAEDAEDARTRRVRFDIELLAARLAGAIGWLRTERPTGHLPLGLFGASTGAAAALVAAALRPEDVRAVVSRGGRPDLAGEALVDVRAPTLLIVGGADVPVVGMNQDAMSRMSAEVELSIVAGATHLFEEPGALEHVADLAGGHFRRHLS